jgi:hypothetical protein
MAELVNWQRNGPIVLAHVIRSPMTLAFMSYLDSKTDAEWFDVSAVQAQCVDKSADSLL